MSRLWLGAVFVVLLGLVHVLEHPVDDADASHACVVCAHGAAHVPPLVASAPALAAIPLVIFDALTPIVAAPTALAVPCRSRGPPDSFIA